MSLNYLKTLLFILLACSALSAAAYDYYDGQFYYNLDSQSLTASITNDKGSYSANAYAGDIVVPETVEVEGVVYTVTSIGRRAFYGSSKVTSIELPSTITSIGQYAFSETSITSITIPESISMLDKFTCLNCPKLADVNLPSGLTTIEMACFSQCPSLRLINLPRHLGYLGEEAFSSCSNLESINLSPSLTFIGYKAFYRCRSLKSIDVPNYVTKLDVETFRECTNLEHVSIGSGIREFAAYVFADCPKLTSIYCAADGMFTATNSNVFEGTPITTAFLRNDLLPNFAQKYFWRTIFKHLKPLTLEQPTVSIVDGSLNFSTVNNLNYTSEPEVYEYSILVSNVVDEETEYTPAEDSEFGEMLLTYDIRVRSTLTGCTPTPETFVSLCWLDHDVQLIDPADDQGTATGLAPLPTLQQRPVVVDCRSGDLAISGLTDGECAHVYSTDGRLLGSATANAGVAHCSAASGQVVIVRVGHQSFKVRVK